MEARRRREQPVVGGRSWPGKWLQTISSAVWAGPSPWGRISDDVHLRGPRPSQPQLPPALGSSGPAAPLLPALGLRSSAATGTLPGRPLCLWPGSCAESRGPLASDIPHPAAQQAWEVCPTQGLYGMPVTSLSLGSFSSGRVSRRGGSSSLLHSGALEPQA